MEKANFSYAEFTGRNIGFVSTADQAKLRQAKVFIAGVGGMGGAALMNLVRAGVGEVWIADFDRFDVTNFNRQLFANLSTAGVGKIEATVAQILLINPELKIQTFGEEWIENLSEILSAVDLVINGCDDSRATILLMRAAGSHGKTVIDAFASPLPSVYVVAPTDARPEKWMGYPTLGIPPEKWTPEVLRGCVLAELQYVLTRSSSMEYVEIEPTREFFAGTRKRFSLAPMVIATGSLMAFEALRILLGRGGNPARRGYFLNPWRGTIEKPPLAIFLPWRFFRAYRFFKKIA
jgi:hypothetical protein